MTKAIEKCAKSGRSAGRFTCSVLDADSKARKKSSVKREKPRVELHAEKKEGTTMTKRKRLDSLTRLESLMSHPYGVVFNDIETIRDCRPESFKKLEKPIDLETVKSTLENNLYFTVEAFAEDVRTTFSNAMQIFPATDDVHKMATKLSQKFEMGFKIKVKSLHPQPKTCNHAKLSEKKETQEKKINSSSHKRKSEATSSGREKIYVVRQESNRKGKRVSVTGTHMVKGKDGKSFDITVVSTAPQKFLDKLESSVAISPRRAARIAALMDKFSGTIKKAEKELSASVRTDRNLKRKDQLKVIEQREREGQLKVKEQSKSEREVLMKEQRKRNEREALERMKNTAKFGVDHEALKEFEWLLRYSEYTMTDNNIILAKNIGEEVGVEEIEEGEIPPSPRALEILH